MCISFLLFFNTLFGEALFVVFVTLSSCISNKASSLIRKRKKFTHVSLWFMVIIMFVQQLWWVCKFCCEEHNNFQKCPNSRQCFFVLDCFIIIIDWKIPLCYFVFFFLLISKNDFDDLFTLLGFRCFNSEKSSWTCLPSGEWEQCKAFDKRINWLLGSKWSRF